MFLMSPKEAISADELTLPSSDKMRIMGDVLKARSAGDLEETERLLMVLHQYSPEDSHIRRLLAEVRSAMELNLPADPSNQQQAGVVDSSPLQHSADPRWQMGEQAGIALESDSISLVEEYLEQQKGNEALLLRGRAQMNSGDYEGAQNTFSTLRSREPGNIEALRYLAEISRKMRENEEWNRIATKEQMLHEVVQGWQRPQIFDRDFTVRTENRHDAIRDKMNVIMVPRVSFSGVPLSRVVDTLSELSMDYDPDGDGINMVLIDPAGTDPSVHITLRGLTLGRVLDFIVEAVGYEYDIQPDAVVVRQGQGTGTRLETEFFPISRSTIIRLTGIGASRPTAGSVPFDPFAPSAFVGDRSGSGLSDEEESLRNFLQRAGVPFETVDGANLALADGQLIVTQTPRNMEKVRNILRRYTEVKQVEIEARFLEVRQGDLEELGVEWTVRRGSRETYSNTPSRHLSGAFGVSSTESVLGITSPLSTDSEGNISGTNLTRPVLAPKIPNTIDLAADAGYVANISGVIGRADVEMLIRALERKSGNDLMSAPKVTVLSGKTAEITVAQELRYPQSYGDISAQVGRGDSSGSGSAGVAITAGTPMDFVVRNVGVEMEVTPVVEDDYSISLLLEPRVTEFEGFVEYGGTSVAIASNTTVTVPSGFFQPIFSVRRVRTEVTIWDGATVVMGGLTREQAISVQDKVPLLGDIPLLGRLFRSEGKSSEKRNLLIFVTANLISPGGSPQRQGFQSVEAGSLFQNPTLVTPGGANHRGSDD